MEMSLRRRARRSRSLSWLMSWPSTTIWPLVGSISRLSRRTSVDLPEPDRPMMTKTSPASMVKWASNTPMDWPVRCRMSCFDSPCCTRSSAACGWSPKTLNTCSMRICLATGFSPSLVLEVEHSAAAPWACPWRPTREAGKRGARCTGAAGNTRCATLKGRYGRARMAREGAQGPQERGRKSTVRPPVAFPRSGWRRKAESHPDESPCIRAGVRPVAASRCVATVRARVNPPAKGMDYLHGRLLMKPLF